MKTLNDKLKWLGSLGCYPCISRRGNIWRAHINAAGNQWDEGDTPAQALDKAIDQWERSGRTMDGYAVVPNKSEPSPSREAQGGAQTVR